MPPRRSRVSRLGLAYFILLSGLLFGGSLWLDRRGDTVTATVTDKQEEITVQQVPEGGWYRWYRVGVEFGTRDGGLGMATVDVPEARFDALHHGDTLQVRYLPFFPLLARAADRATVNALWDAAERLFAEPFLLPFLVWLGGGFVALWIAARVATLAVMVAGLAWIAFAFPPIFPAPAPLPPVSVETPARVEAVTLVTKAPARRTVGRRRAWSGSDAVRRLALPYQVVQFRFAVPGRPDSVLAVDAVDSASVPGLAVGATLAVRYDPRVPRRARLSQGSRTFRERNRYHFLVPLLGVGFLGVLGAWGWRVRRERQGGIAT